MNEYKGFSLFSDIDDTDLRNRNRAVVLANIAENNSRNQRIGPNGMGLILGYFNEVPVADRDDVKERFKVCMQQRGFELV